MQIQQMILLEVITLARSIENHGQDQGEKGNTMAQSVIFTLDKPLTISEVWAK